MGVQHNFFSRFLPKAQSPTRLTEAELRGAAASQQEIDEWLQLDHNLKYVLIITTTAAAATLCRQYQHEIGLEIYRQILLRFKTPLGTRSIGYQTKLLEPSFDTNNFEESFSNWEYDTTIRIRQQHKSTRSSQTGSSDEQNKRTLAATPTSQCKSITNIRWDTDNNHWIPTSTHNLQQVTTESIISRSNQQRKIHRARKRKHKGKKGKKGNKGKGYGTTSIGKLHLTVNKRKRKSWTRNAFQRTTWQRKRKVLQ